jgi:hypothetical protein
MRNWQVVLLPELAQFSPEDRRAALRKARNTEMDVVELAGVALVLLLVTWVTGYSFDTQAGALARAAAFFANLALALPLLLAGALPFHLRRLRRGLRSQLSYRPPP